MIDERSVGYGVLGHGVSARLTVKESFRTYGLLVLAFLVLSPVYSYLECVRTEGFWNLGPITCICPSALALAPGIFLYASIGAFVVVVSSLIVNKLQE